MDDKSALVTQESMSLDEVDIVKSLNELVDRCKHLLRELDIFAAYLQEKRAAHRVEIRPFRNSIQQELKALEKRRRKANVFTEVTESLQHVVSSTNIPYFETVWAIAKRTSGLVSIKLKHRLVDIEAENGSLWIKVANQTQKRLLFELAKQGWEQYGMSDDESEDEELQKPTIDGSDEGGLGLLKVAKKIAREADEEFVNYKRPRIHFVMPRIQAGEVLEIDRVLKDVQATGATIQCATDNPPTSPPVGEVLETLLTPEFESFTTTLNIDCTILLALVSDICHSDVEEQPYFSHLTKGQIEKEKKGGSFMIHTLYPAMSNRKLVCTEEAAERMQEIVDAMATPSERRRTELLMGKISSFGRDETLREYQRLSKHPVPSDWQIPVQIVSKDVSNADLPLVAERVAPHLSSINRSVFIYGWASGFTTLTSNKTTAKQIERLILQHRKNEAEIGPHVWSSSTSRSLLAKEKDKLENGGIRTWKAIKRTEDSREGLEYGWVVEYPSKEHLGPKKGECGSRYCYHCKRMK